VGHLPVWVRSGRVPAAQKRTLSEVSETDGSTSFQVQHNAPMGSALAHEVVVEKVNHFVIPHDVIGSPIARRKFGVVTGRML
jgi:hypothetical protein